MTPRLEQARHPSRYLLPSTLTVALLLTACGNDAGTGAAGTETEAGAADTEAATDDEPSAGEGADTALLGTAERDDGSLQVTYDDWPPVWQGDQEPGDVTGQNVNEVWSVVSPRRAL